MKNQNQVITNQYTVAMQRLADADNSTSDINLVESANQSEVTTSVLLDVYEQAINGLLGTKNVIISDLKPADMLVHGRLKQAFKRHSSAVIQQELLSNFDRPQAANILRHIKTTSTGLEFSGKALSVKLNNFSCFNCYANQIVVLGSPKFDTESQAYQANITVVEANIADMVTAYDVWLAGLSDDIPALVSDNTTRPSAELQLIDASAVDKLSTDSIMLQKELDNSRAVTAIKEQDIKTSQTEIDTLNARIAELELENALLFDELSPSKQKRLKAA